MVWLHFHALFALSKVWSTLVFVPYIKDTAILQTQKDTSLFTRQKAEAIAACCFSSFVTRRKRFPIRVLMPCTSAVPRSLGTVWLW